MRVAVTRDGKTFDEPLVVPTPRDFEDGVRTLVGLARELSGGEQIKKVAGGIAGTLGTDRNILIHSPNNPEWMGKPVRATLEEKLGVPVRVENDAALAGLGEATFGAGKNFSIVAYVTVSTGIGGARIVERAIDPSAYGFEPGFQIVSMADGENGYLEKLSSGSALRKKYNMPAEDITDEAVWSEFEKILAVGLHNSILHWSPDVVVIGGAIAEKGKFFSVERVHDRVAHILHAFPTPMFTKAKLGDSGGLYGALSTLSLLQ